MINIFLPLNLCLRLRQRDENKKTFRLKEIWKTRWTKVGIWLSLQTFQIVLLSSLVQQQRREAKMIWQPAFCKICAWLIYETNKTQRICAIGASLSSSLWKRSSLPLIWTFLMYVFARCHQLRKQTLVPVCRSFRRSTASSSWTKEDLWWPSDTRRCQLGIFGEGPAQICASALASLTQFKSICGSSLPDPTVVRSLRLTFDEGRNWDKYSFTSSPLYVDGVLGEPGEDILIMT